MLEARIQRQLFEASDLLAQGAGSWAPTLADASQLLWDCISGGGKLLAAGGQGAGRWMARWLVSNLAGTFERPRPPMAALALDSQPPATMAGQLQALAQPGDLLLVVEAGDACDELLTLVATAHEAGVSVLVLTGPETARWATSLDEADLLIAVPHERPARVAEVHLLLLHVLCDAVDLQLMGDNES